MKFKFLVIILFCLCCATAKGQNVSQTLESNGCSFAMVDTFSPRYAMMRHGKDIVAWNIDSEQKMTLK
ncbi:MAG: hypothetical protein LBB88_01615, partial [Planctomycetaceae bacterium]|nr:hypothetical protein [Planctomycetaceae bacterium]